MFTYLQRATDGKFCKLNCPPATTKKLINTGAIMGLSVVKATPALRKAGNYEVPAVRVLANGTLGYL